MKKSLLSVLFLCLILASFHTAGAKECGGTAGGYTLSPGVWALTFDDACTSIADSAFQGIASFVSVDLSNTSVTSIGDMAFASCLSLASVKFPATLTSIGEMAFDGCDSLASVDLSNTALTSIGNDAFSYCDSLGSVDLSNTALTSIGMRAFADCDSLASVKFPASLTSIGDDAFTFTPLASVKFPAALTSIGKKAFYGCYPLASVDLSNTALTSIGNDAFYGIASPSTITVKYGSEAHELLGGLNSVTGDPIKSDYGNNSTLIVKDPPTPTPDPLDPTPLPTATPQPGTASGAADVIRVVPLPEDEFGSYELDPVTGEKNYLMFNTYDICMNFLNNDELCSGYEHCYHK